MCRPKLATVKRLSCIYIYIYIQKLTVIFVNDPIDCRLHVKFTEAGAFAKGVFLEGLEPQIVRGNLKALNPTVAKDMIDHFQSHGQVARLEVALLNMDPLSMDINQVYAMLFLVFI